MYYQFLRFKDGKSKAVTFSYDDGCCYDIRMAETLSKYGIKGTFNICNGRMGSDSWHLEAEQIKEHILDKGHEIAVHGDFHLAPGLVRPIEGIKDILNCRMGLEEKFGILVRGMAYPDTGIKKMTLENSYEEIRNYISSLGIVYARSLDADNDSFNLPVDWLNWIPTAHHTNPNLMKYIDKFLENYDEKTYSTRRNAKLFYLWGHSFEFENNHNWELLDEICEKLSNKDNVWYATNMEIYEYVSAYNQLVYSADGHKVYNPTRTDIWFEYYKELYSVKAGETIVIK